MTIISHMNDQDLLFAQGFFSLGEERPCLKWGRTRIAVSAFILLFLFAVESAAYLGGRADAYLRAPVGATAQAMGGASTAAPSSYPALWNPAALSAMALAEKRIAAGAGLRSMGRADGCVSLEFRIPTRLGVGVAALYRGDPVIDIYDADEYHAGTGSYATLSSKLAISYLFTRALSIGVAAGLSYQTLPADFYYLDHAWTFMIGVVDAGAQFRISDRWTLALVVQNLNAITDWQFAAYSAGGWNQTSSPALPAVVTVASESRFLLHARPLLWACDARVYAVDGTFKPLDHASLVINNGLEWQRWDSFFLRCGLSELTLDGEILRNAQAYAERFWLGLHAGFMADVSGLVKGLRLNYGISLGKAWSGVDQQIDVQYSF